MFPGDARYPLEVAISVPSTGTLVERALEALRDTVRRYVMPLTSFQRFTVVCTGDNDPEYTPARIQLAAHILDVTKPEFRTMEHINACVASHLTHSYGFGSPTVTLTHLTEQCDVGVRVIIARQEVPRDGVSATLQRDHAHKELDRAQRAALDVLQEMFGRQVERERVTLKCDLGRNIIEIDCPIDKIESRELGVVAAQTSTRLREELSFMGARW